MKIWFGCSTSQFIKYKDNYFRIRDFIVEEGHILTRDWLKPTKESIERGAKEFGPEELYSEIMSAVAQADALVIEDTVPSFSTGHHITIGIQRQKPVLVLRSKKKPKYFNRTFMDGLRSPYLQVAEYNEQSYKEIIRGFINKYEDSTKKHRFNLVIDEVERKYLEWAKFKTNQSKTQIIRSSLRKTIDNDLNYKEYLSKENF